MNPRFIMIGGFLGAGKTTTVARLARQFVGQGLRVAIVTNDQTDDLVDTQSLRSQGFDVGEVAGSCFCCNFNGLTATIEKLSADQLPDVILAEPVGSCTDLVATVIRPIMQVYDRPLDVAPYGVILKPSHGLKILRNVGKGGFSPQAAYIFRKQLEEADFIILNRIDELSPQQVEELCNLLDREFPDSPVVSMSAKTGEGFDAFTEMLEQRGRWGERLMEVDYDIYAAGEAELGWLNCQVTVQAEQPFGLDQLLLDLIGHLHRDFMNDDIEAAHLKVIGMHEGHYAVANLVSNSTLPELSLASQAILRSVDLVVNARVATDPQALEKLVREALSTVCQQIHATQNVSSLQSFRPGRPVPTHRI